MTRPEIHLVIPQLFQPLELWSKDFQFVAEAKHLSALLSCFQLESDHYRSGINASIFSMLGLKDQELPVAYYRSQTHRYPYSLSRLGAEEKTYRKRGGVLINNSARTLLCADPCHLEVGINDITLTDQVTDLSFDDAKTIVDALNQHFNQDGLEFYYGDQGQWYLSLPSIEPVATTPIDQVLRKNIVNYLPQSKQRNWKIIQNESQMLLHGLAINQKREMQGLPTINSLWFWGAGQKRIDNSNVSTVYGGLPENAGMLATAAACDWKPMDQTVDMDEVLNTIKVSQQKSVLVLEDLSLLATYDQTEQYQHALEEIDTKVIKPLFNQWKNGQLDIVIDGCDGVLVRPKKRNSWALWKRKSRPLLEISKDIQQKCTQ